MAAVVLDLGLRALGSGLEATGEPGGASASAARGDAFGVSTPSLVAMFVRMALVATPLTGPALSLQLGRRGFDSVAPMQPPGA